MLQLRRTLRALIRSLGSFDAAATAAKEVNFIVDGEGKREIVLGDRTTDREIAIGRAIAGDALTLRSGSRRERRELRGDLHGGSGAGLLEARDGYF